MDESRKSQVQKVASAEFEILHTKSRAEACEGPNILPLTISQSQIPPLYLTLDLPSWGVEGAAPVVVLSVSHCFLPPPESPVPDA